MAHDKGKGSKRQQRKGKKQGFHVGPTLPKHAYKGHLKRIKEGLIHKAKLKKEYSKALREEALESGQAAPRRSPAKQKQAEDDNEDETSAEEGDEEDREERSPAAEASQTQEQQKKKRHRGGKSYRRPAPPPEAAASSSRPGKPRRLSPEELEKVRVQKSKDKQVWGRRTQRGQPQLGKRVEVLLGKLQRERA